MSKIKQFPMDYSLRKLHPPRVRSAVQIIPLPVEVIPEGLGECWIAFLCLSGTAEPSVNLACPGVSDGVRLPLPFVARSVFTGQGFPFFGPISGNRDRHCSAEDALRLARAAISAIPATAGEFAMKWAPCDPAVPF